MTADPKIFEAMNYIGTLSEAEAIACYKIFTIMYPIIDEVTTKEAYVIFGGRRRFDYHVKAGHIQPIRGHSKKARKYWSRTDIYNLKRAEQMTMNLI
jgi:hypothetical protein